jgi:hypothetical protein
MWCCERSFICWCRCHIDCQLPFTMTLSLLCVRACLQALSYDFQFYRQPVPVSVCPVVLSEGRSLMRDALPLSLPLHATADLASSPEQVGKEGAAQAMCWCSGLPAGMPVSGCLTQAQHGSVLFMQLATASWSQALGTKDELSLFAPVDQQAQSCGYLTYHILRVPASTAPPG